MLLIAGLIGYEGISTEAVGKVSKLESLVIYLCKSRLFGFNAHYLRYLVFLCDWLSALDYEKTITGEKWVRAGIFGPSTASLNPFWIGDEIRKSPYIKVIADQVIVWPRWSAKYDLDENEISVADTILSMTKGFSLKDLALFVSGTYPFRRSNNLYETFDLLALADEYREESRRIRRLDRSEENVS